MNLDTDYPQRCERDFSISEARAKGIHMAGSVDRSQGDAQSAAGVSVELRGSGDGESPTSASGDGLQGDASGHKSTYWDIAKKITLTSTMAWISAGYGLNNHIYRAVGFGHLSAYSAEKAAESAPIDRESAATNLSTAVGTAVWAAGIAADNHIMQAAGPAVNTASSLTSAVLQWREGKEGWRRELFDVAEMAAFTAGGYTGNPVARAVAFGSSAAGFFWDAKEDKSLVGHGLGAVAWAVGAGMKSNSMQAMGAGAVAAAEATRLAYPLFEYLRKKYAEQSAPVAAMELPRYEQRNSATTAEPAPAASVAARPVNPVAAASDPVASAASIPLPPFSPVSSAVSTPVSAAASSPVLLTAYTANSPAAPQWYAPSIPAFTHHAAVAGETDVSSRPSTAPTQMLVPSRAAVRRASR